MRILLLFSALVLLCACATTTTGQKSPQTTTAQSAPAATPDLRDRWGVEVVAIRLTAAGRMLDFRYKVLDAEKAAPLFDRRITPHLLHESSGAYMEVPIPAKTGPLRTSDPPQAGKIYWMFFRNSGPLVKAGDQVTVIIGDFRAEHLVVE